MEELAKEPTVAEVIAAKQRKRSRYKSTHMLLLGDKDIPGMDCGFRGVHLLKVGRKLVYLVDTGQPEQALRKCPLETWVDLMRSKSTRVLTTPASRRM